MGVRSSRNAVRHTSKNAGKANGVVDACETSVRQRAASSSSLASSVTTSKV
jgi:hypothetical protein